MILNNLFREMQTKSLTWGYILHMRQKFYDNGITAAQ